MPEELAAILPAPDAFYACLLSTPQSNEPLEDIPRPGTTSGHAPDRRVRAVPGGRAIQVPAGDPRGVRRASPDVSTASSLQFPAHLRLPAAVTGTHT